MVRSLLFLSAFILLLASCKQAEETRSNEDILIGGQWKRSSLKATFRGPDGNMVTQDVYASVPGCIKDNTLEFQKALKGLEYRNNKCSNGDASEAPFTWEFYNSGNNLRIYNANETFGTSDINAEIVLLSDNLLSFRYKAIEQDPISQTMDTTTLVDVFRR